MACAGQRNPEGNAVLPQQPHRPQDLLEDTCSATGVRARLPAFYRDGWEQVPRLGKTLADFLINQSAIGEHNEETVGVVFDQIHNPFPLRPVCKRFASTDHKETRPLQGLCLYYDAVHDAPVEVPCGLRGIRVATSAAQIAAFARAADQKGRRAHPILALAALGG